MIFEAGVLALFVAATLGGACMVLVRLREYAQKAQAREAARWAALAVIAAHRRAHALRALQSKGMHPGHGAAVPRLLEEMSC